MTTTRRLAAILAADVAGYSRLIEADEEGTLGRLKALRADIIDPKIAGHKGRIVKTTGDGMLVEFASVVDAVRCASELQVAMAESNAPLPQDHRIEFRIGIHQGDIVVEDGDIFGDGVNIAARLEGLAEPGGICVSARVREDATGRLDLAFEDIGEQSLKNITRPGNRVRITAQLIEAKSGAHLWADRFDGSLEDVFDLQDKVAVSVAGIIEPALQRAEMRRSAERPTTDLSAYDLYLRALAIHFPASKESVSKALSLLEQAITIDPHYGRALSWAAVCLRTLTINRWIDAPDAGRRKAVEFTRKALQVTDNDPGVLGNAAIVLAEFGEDIGVPMALVDRALALNPSDARCWYASGVVRLWAGQPDVAISHVETSLRLSPRERTGTSQSRLGEARFFQRRFDEAASTLLLSIQENPGAPVAYRFLAACYAHMGRLDEARSIIGQLRSITAVVVPSALPYRNPENRELLLSGLRLAAGETE